MGLLLLNECFPRESILSDKESRSLVLSLTEVACKSMRYYHDRDGYRFKTSHALFLHGLSAICRAE